MASSGYGQVCCAFPWATNASATAATPSPSTSAGHAKHFTRTVPPSDPLLTVEARRLVDAAGALVRRVLRIRAQRTGAIDLAVRRVRCRNKIGRLSLLDPLLERRERIELMGPFAAPAVRHARSHEQAIRRVHRGSTAVRRHHAIVVG